MDLVVLDAVVITAGSIQFHNISSVGSNFTNTNATFDAVATFIGLEVGRTVLNVNTSVNLFTSSSTLQDFNATFTTGQVIRIIIVGATATAQQPICNSLIPGIAQFFEVAPIIFSIVAIIITLLIVGGIIFIVQDPSRLDGFNIDFSTIKVGAIILGFGIVALISIVAIITLAVLCTV